ncbi:MAG: SET domain-containing protein-lysine N-methyltransferase [Pseudomonadota bacterium]
MPAVHSYRSPKIKVSDDTLAGRGVVAAEPISLGEVVAIKAGHIVDRQTVEKITAELGDFSLQIHDDFYLTPTTAEEVDQTTIFINHSCDANVGFQGSNIYVAIRDIAAGEELCHDYAMARTDGYTLNCHCGAAECRGTVTGDDWRLPEVQQKYGDYFVFHVLQRIRELNAT